MYRNPKQFEIYYRLRSEFKKATSQMKSIFAVQLSNKLLGQGYVKERLKSPLKKFYGRYWGLTKQYEVPLSRILHDIPPLIGHYTIF